MIIIVIIAIMILIINMIITIIITIIIIVVNIIIISIDIERTIKIDSCESMHEYNNNYMQTLSMNPAGK